jgi:hypothetical protein
MTIFSFRNSFNNIKTSQERHDKFENNIYTNFKLLVYMLLTSIM